MTDAKPAPGDPIEEGAPVEDVVGQANEALADAEAAQREIVAESDTPIADGLEAEPTVVETGVESPVLPEPPVAQTTVLPEAPAAPVTDVYESALVTEQAPSLTPSEPVAAEIVPPAPLLPQPIFVQAPEAPRPRGNRAAAGAIGLLAALSFAVLYFGSALLIYIITGAVEPGSAGTLLLSAATSWWVWVPTVVFFLGFWLLGAIINRGRWAHWVIWGVLVGFVAFGGQLLGVLFQAPFWELSSEQVAGVVEVSLFTPASFAALVIGRELTVWFGAWVAARGRKVSEQNAEAQREYERTLEAGPQLQQG